GGIGLGVPHRQSYFLDRESLLKIASPSELGLRSAEGLPEAVLLLNAPEERHPREQQLLACWRVLVHARIHQAPRPPRDKLHGHPLRQRIAGIGPVAFEEARDVLHQENLLFDPDDPAEVYKEFAAVYLELRHFDPHRLAQFFPAILDTDDVDGLFAADLD